MLLLLCNNVPGIVQGLVGYYVRVVCLVVFEINQEILLVRCGNREDLPMAVLNIGVDGLYFRSILCRGFIFAAQQQCR